MKVNYREEVNVEVKVEVVKALPVLVRLLPVLLAFLLLAVGVAEAGGPKMPPDADPF
ncbi:MAG: hypothetical protein ACO2O2_04505 [Acidilobaceae archaeon]